MNKVLTVLLTIFSLSVIGTEMLTVNCTTYPIWLLTRQITDGVKNVRTELMIPAGTGCPHEYVLTPADMRKLGKKNLIVVRNGLGLDDFILRPLQKMNPKAPVIDACEGLALLKSECGCHHEHHHDHGHHHVNPHLFASPDTALGMVGNIIEGLCKADPENAESYRRNGTAFEVKLRGLMTEVLKLATLVNGKAVVVQHGVFDYLARALGLKIVAEIQGEGIAPSAAEMRKLAGAIRREKAAVIFTEPQYSEQTAKTLSKECGIGICQLDPLASGPANPHRDHYLVTMRDNLKKIRGVLAK